MAIDRAQCGHVKEDQDGLSRPTDRLIIGQIPCQKRAHISHNVGLWALVSGIFRGDILQRLGVNQKYGRTQVHVFYKHATLYLHLEFVDRHQTERVPGPHKFNLNVNFIQQTTILKKTCRRVCDPSCPPRD